MIQEWLMIQSRLSSWNLWNNESEDLQDVDLPGKHLHCLRYIILVVISQFNFTPYFNWQLIMSNAWEAVLATMYKMHLNKPWKWNLHFYGMLQRDGATRSWEPWKKILQASCMYSCLPSEQGIEWIYGRWHSLSQSHVCWKLLGALRDLRDKLSSYSQQGQAVLVSWSLDCL